MSKRAIILAGGKGTRLKPFTIALPKPLVPIGEKPVLGIIIEQLVNNDFDHITLAINHLADIIKAVFGTGEKWGVKIDYSLENKALSTMGPLSLINDLPENFLIMNGDVLSDINYKEFYNSHVSEQNIFTISSYKRIQLTDYGVLEIGGDDLLTGFKEKPKVEYEVSMGIYMANKEILKYIPKNQPYGFDNLMIDLIKNRKPAKVKRHNGYWLDIGRPDDYEKACDDIEQLFTGVK
ncbi:MAG TPA: sugar phosphate nucleotidyltransferase [bacterium]|nr:sugar phosphate nucleotidyltransferase [bacterium]HPN42138.1 sugar phosphate nucleotidyltransferase [bacterium]